MEEVYEDVFDSYSMDLNTFKRQLQARLSEYNDNEEGYVCLLYTSIDLETNKQFEH